MLVFCLMTSLGYSGTTGTLCQAKTATVPCERKAWNVGIEALYLEPYYNGFLTYLAPQQVATNTFKHSQIGKEYGWGFRIEGSYHFSTGKDLKVNWLHYKNRVATEQIGENNQVFINHTTPQIDAVNIEIGQLVHYGESAAIRFHGGGQYAQIKNPLYIDSNGIAQFDIQTKANIIGPRLGADMMYDFQKGFTAFCNGAGALLAGKNKFHNVSPRFSSVHYGESTDVTPLLEAKLGAQYTHRISDSEVKLKLGWMWLKYFNIYQTFANRTNNIEQSDLSLQGPFAGVVWIG